MDDVAGAGLAAVYLVDAEAEELRIVHTGGGPGGFALPETLPLTADPPLADAVRADQPLWRDSVELPSYRESREVVPDPRTTRVALGVVPLGPLPPGTGGRAKGCFVVVNDARDGFGPERRVLLETYAEQLSSVMEIGAPWTAGFAPPRAGGALGAPRHLRAGSPFGPYRRGPEPARTGRHRPGDVRRLCGEPGRARPSGRPP